jgi:hypothetical protein
MLTQDLRLHPERYTKVKVKLFGKNKPAKYSIPYDDPLYIRAVDSLEREYDKKNKN